MNWLSIAGDAFQILSLAFIGATLRQLAARIGAEIRLPMPWSPKIGGRGRLARNTAFAIMFGAPLAVALGLSFAGRWTAAEPYLPLIFFCLKTATAGLFAMNHLNWMRSMLRTLLVEGVLKP